jgi:DNA repair exonuclease SbcCD nuclease subunit
MIKVIHTADWHLRDMQFGKTARAQDFTDSVFRIVDIAVQNQVDYILCAGDILNSKRPSSRNIADLIRLNQKLLANKVKLFVITGNHDKCHPSWIKVLQEEMQENGQCAIYDIDFQLVSMRARDGKEYTVYGVPDMAPDDFREKSVNFPEADFMMFHALIKDFASFNAGDKVLKVDDLPTDKYKAILLGDIHTHKYIKKNDCLVGYPGSTELCSRNEDINKFVSLITLQDSGRLEWDSIPLKLNKPIIAEDVRTVEEANDLLLRINDVKDEHPTILVRKDPVFTDLYMRIARIVDTSKCIIRVTNLQTAGFKLLNIVSRRTDNPVGKQPVDFISDYFPNNSDIFELAQALCDPQAAAPHLLENFIDKRLYANQKTTNKKFG